MFGAGRVRVLGLLCAGLVVFAFILTTGAEAPANPAFQRVWERTDKPVADGLVGRTWQWGPQGNTGALQEPYAEAPGGQRTVQYFDKSRMEITNPSGDSNSIWYVTNGLLVVELMTGRLQLGDNTFEQHTPAAVNVAGDADDTLGPQYATFASLRGAPPLADGALITQTVDRNGAVGNDSQYASYGVTAAHRVTVPGIDHRVASPFWQFMNSSGPVYENGVVGEALLFPEAFYATGLPITEAYWVRIKVGGTVKPVLLQCFERRCLTYTPDNPPGWQVEQGNVGQHYYQWRYADIGAPNQPTPTATPTATATEPPATDYDFVHKFGGPSDPANDMTQPSGIAIADAYIYVVDATSNRVQKFDLSLSFVTQWGSSGTGDGQLDTPYSIVVDSNGDLLVVDRNNHRIQKFAPNGQFLMKWGSFGTVAAEFNYPADLAIDPSGNIYVSDADNHRIQKFDSQGKWLSMFGTFGTADGQLYYPHGIDIDAAGNIYVADTFNHRVQVFNSAGQFLRKWGSEGAANGQFNRPYGLRLDPAGERVYVTDTTNDRVQVFDLNGVYQFTIGTSGAGMGQLDFPHGIAFYAEQYLLVAEALNERVQLFEISSGLSIATINGDGRGRFRAPVGVAADDGGFSAVVDAELNQVKLWFCGAGVMYEWGQGQLSAPRDAVFDASGNLYVTDAGHNRVVRFSREGELLDEWGGPGGGPGQFNNPQGIALDASGNVYVVDSGNHRVQKFTAGGDFVRAWGAQGSAPGQFNQPVGVAVHGNAVYVTDALNNRVQQFDLDGNYARLWGSEGAGEGQFKAPSMVDVSAGGYVYVADAGNHRVQKFTPEGAYVARFGSEGIADGQFRAPLGIAWSPGGLVYVTDSENARVQMFSADDEPTCRAVIEASADGAALTGPTLWGLR